MIARVFPFLLLIAGCRSAAPTPPPAPPPAPAAPETAHAGVGELVAITGTGEKSSTATPLSEEDCARLLAIDPQRPKYRLQVPAGLSDGAPVQIGYKLFVTSVGEVFAVEIVDRSRIKRVDVELTRTLLKWRYRPHLVAGKPVHFSCPLHVEVR